MSNENPEILLGPYTEQIRTDYMNYRRARYLVDHPGSTVGEASKVARSKWAQRVHEAIWRQTKAAKK